MQNNNIRFAFFGTPDVAEETLTILNNAGFIPTLIVTSPDRPQGRGLTVTSPPVKTWAVAHNIPILQPEQIDTDFISQISGYDTEIFIIVAYGKILPQALIDIPKKGVLNIHYSLLPKYRGASPVESAILNGDTETGVTIQKMELKMDTGPIIAEEKVVISNTTTTPELKKVLIDTGGNLLAKILPDFTEGKIEPVPQDDNLATYCKKISKEDGVISLSDDPIKNYNKYRAYFAWPGTYFFVNEKRVIIKDAELRDGQFMIKRVIPEGKKEMNYDDFLRN